jgi:hypothetical protein
MAQQSVRAGREHCRKAPTAMGEVGVTDRIDALMKPMQPAVLHCAGNGAPRVAQSVNQLSDRDNTMLPRRKIREQPLASPRP